MGWLARAAIAAYLLLYGFNLGYPKPIFDEIHYVNGVRQILSSKNLALGHPPLALIVTSVLVRSFGDVALVWRLVPLFCGLGLIFVVYFLAKTLTRSTATAVVAAFLFGLDGMAMVNARLYLMGCPMLFLGMLALLVFAQHVIAGKRSRRRAFLLTGVLWGLALATRWQVLSMIVPFLYLLWRLFRKTAQRRGLLVDFTAYVVLPAVLVYIGVFLVLPILMDFNWYYGWRWAIGWHDLVMNYYSYKPGTPLHPSSSKWWTWPLMIRPILLAIDNESWKQGVVRAIYMIGNPAVFWVFPLAVVYLMRIFFFRRPKRWVFASGFLLLGIASQWLPWASRPHMQIIHYFYTVIPFLTIAIALGLTRLWRVGGTGRGLVIFYLAVVVCSYIYWYPLWSMFPISVPYWSHHLWFKTWG